MARFYLVRHGRAAAGWAEDFDPGLDRLGKAQAKGVAQALAHLGPLDVITSPLLRALETAEPLSNLWGCPHRIEQRFGEIPSPIKDLMGRAQWLQDVMGERWSNLGEDLRSWRHSVFEALLSLDADTVVFTHFIVINVVVGAATGDDRLVCFWPDNGSITIVEADGSRLRLIERGDEPVKRVGSGPRIL
ncbi:MAG: histidine phosphatase family protein [Deltaproteobacteria bacterium]|nr:MAG: histidine phosphatase family protein [Deltaproteobacteria bacterium]